MGCGNSSLTDKNSGSRTGGQVDSLSKGPDESLPDDDKWKNYGGVYVGLPTDLSNIPPVQIGALKETEKDLSSLRKPLWGNGL